MKKLVLFFLLAMVPACSNFQQIADYEQSEQVCIDGIVHYAWQTRDGFPVFVPKFNTNSKVLLCRWNGRDWELE